MIDHKKALERAILPVADKDINNVFSAYLELRRMVILLVDAKTDKEIIYLEEEIRRLIKHED